MSLLDDLLTEAKKNQSAAQVPVVQNVNTVAAPAAKPKKDDLAALIKAQGEMIAQLKAELAKKAATQVPATAPAAPVQMTHLSGYPAGINKRTGKAYPAGYKWHAKPFPVGTNAYGGVSIDTLFQIRLEYGPGKELDFFKEIDSVLKNDAVISTTMAFQRVKADKDKIVL